MRKRFTIGDVAKLAGVGKVTVSYVLNGRGDENRISKETQERIFAAARELDYRPSAVARSLVSKRANAISVVFQYAEYFQAGSSFVNELMHGVCEACVEADINLILHTRTFTCYKEEAAALMDGRSDGALILRDFKDPLLQELHSRQFPMVLFFTRSSDSNVSFVDSDNYSGGVTATNHLIDLGHRRIAMVVGSKGSVASNDRHQGYRQALQLANIEFDERLIKEFRAPADVDESFIEWIKIEDPTALVCWSDDVAFSCMKMLSRTGIKVPDQISIIGFDSSEACERVTPHLTSMRQPVLEIARSAARSLILSSQQLPHQQQNIFPMTLDIRESTKPLAIETSSLKRIP
jgi:LacI family transcriptional regulator